VNYTYDGMGALVNRDSSVSGSVYYLNSGTQTLLDSTTSDFAAVTKYTNGTGGLLGKINPALSAEYYYYDALGSLGALADQTGAVTGSYRYDPWGSVIQQNGTTTNRNFVGKFGVTEEAEGGLTHMGDRFYDPSTGVFLQKDPVMGSIEDPISMVPYIYAFNDPVNLIDPSGQMPNSEWFAAKQREWGNTAQQLQTDLRAKGFLGKDGRALAINGKYDENTRQAHWNYYLFREIKGDGYDPAGMVNTPLDINNFNPNAVKTLKAWFGGKLTSVTISGLQNFLRKKQGVSIPVTGEFGPMTKLALLTYLYKMPVKTYTKKPVQGTGQTGQKIATTTTATDNTVKVREAARTGAMDAGWFAIDSTIKEIGTAFGKRVMSPLGTAASGIMTGMDVSATLDNKNYTNSQKITKATIQVGGGAIGVVGGSIIGEFALGSAAPTGGMSLVAGAAAIGELGYVINRSQNWLYRKLGL
jgi:RHS repeat-associated protein